MIMGALANIYIKVETLKQLHDTIVKKGEKGVSLTIGINDETNQFGQNLSAHVSQTKEQREAGANKFYVGNGGVFWTDGKIEKAVKVDNSQPNAPVTSEAADDGLPF
jgi:hypothetical protein